MASVVIGDYEYDTYYHANYAYVKVVDNTKTSYDNNILSMVTIDDVQYPVTDMSECFSGCTNLEEITITINDTVTNLSSCFQNCTKLVSATIKTNSVTNMEACFDGCSSLTEVFIISNSVTNMQGCFWECTSLVNAPTIPNGVTNMQSCFWGCTNLTTAPIIPDSVNNATRCFYRCTNLTGAVVAYHAPDAYNIFQSTTQPITVYTTGDNKTAWENIVNGQSNISVVVTYGAQINYTLLSSRRLTDIENEDYGTTNGVRIDMLLDCNGSYALINMLPNNGKLYNINNTQIMFPYRPPNLIRCYLIYEPVNQVSTNKLSIVIQNMPNMSYSLQVDLPSTATISQFNHNGTLTTMLAPQINNMTSVRLNPQGYGSFYNINNILMYIYQNITGETLQTINNTNTAQINVLNEGGGLDIKHYVTTADNIQVTTDKTLQDIITECYNALDT